MCYDAALTGLGKYQMTCILTGATGLIGNAIAETFASDDLVRLGRSANRSDRLLDLDQPDSVGPGLLEGGAVLIHAAGITDENFRDAPKAAWCRATATTARLVEAARLAGIERLAYISSAHVYGPLEGTIDEGMPLDPRSDYAIAHMASEMIFRRAALQHGLDTLILRPCAVYGFPSDLDGFTRFSLIPFAFPREAVDQGTITLKSRGDQSRNFVSNAMIATRIQQWLADQQVPGRVTVENPLGPDDLSVYGFACLTSERHHVLTGKKCDIHRPDGLDQSPQFTYASRRDGRQKPSHLVGFIDGLIKHFIA